MASSRGTAALNVERPPGRRKGKTALQLQIDATDRQIDRLVYELYGLTEEEIGIVEGAKRANNPPTA